MKWLWVLGRRDFENRKCASDLGMQVCKLCVLKVGLCRWNIREYAIVLQRGICV